nr:MAG TPA: hypothetical protein [Caudoviricetes sp.]
MYLLVVDKLMLSQNVIKVNTKMSRKVIDRRHGW